MSELPLISVIIPCYNQAAYLEEAVRSVQSQDYPDVQIIVINDGSTDTSAVVAKGVGGIEYLEQENSGVCQACNRAFQAVRGEYLLRLDADDYLPAGYLATLQRTLAAASSEVAFAYCDAHFFGAREGVLTAGPFSLGRLVHENYIHVSALVRSSVIRELGYFNLNMQYGLEDWDLWLTLVEGGYRGVYTPDTYLCYRQKAESGRNSMQAERYRQMRRQVYANHAKLYGQILNQLRVAAWRLKKRWQRSRAS